MKGQIFLGDTNPYGDFLLRYYHVVTRCCHSGHGGLFKSSRRDPCRDMNWNNDALGCSIFFATISGSSLARRNRLDDSLSNLRMTAPCSPAEHCRASWKELGPKRLFQKRRVNRAHSQRK